MAGNSEHRPKLSNSVGFYSYYHRTPPTLKKNLLWNHELPNKCSHHYQQQFKRIVREITLLGSETPTAAAAPTSTTASFQSRERQTNAIVRSLAQVCRTHLPSCTRLNEMKIELFSIVGRLISANQRRARIQFKQVVIAQIFARR